MECLNRLRGALGAAVYRALNQLERMQRQRRGESVPPPLSYGDQHARLSWVRFAESVYEKYVI